MKIVSRLLISLSLEIRMAEIYIYAVFRDSRNKFNIDRFNYFNYYQVIFWNISSVSYLIIIITACMDIGFWLYSRCACSLFWGIDIRTDFCRCNFFMHTSGSWGFINEEFVILNFGWWTYKFLIKLIID